MPLACGVYFSQNVRRKSKVKQSKTNKGTKLCLSGILTALFVRHIEFNVQPRPRSQDPGIQQL